jgi:hypothetical protein
MNWMALPIWAKILVASRAVGLNMSPIAIEHYLKVHNPSQFAMITAQVIRRWIECPAHGLPRWTDKVLACTEAAAGCTTPQLAMSLAVVSWSVTMIPLHAHI